MGRFAIFTADQVCRRIIVAEDMIDALTKFEKEVNNRSISDGATAIKFSDYLKTRKK